MISTAQLRAIAAKAAPESRRAIEAQLSPRRLASPAHHPARVGKPGSLFLTVGIQTVNELNQRAGHWGARKARAQREHETVAMALLAGGMLPALPVTVNFCRIGKGNRPMDADGCSASLKHVQDAIARAYGIDDADPRIEFAPPSQRTREPEYGVEIRITTRRKT